MSDSAYQSSNVLAPWSKVPESRCFQSVVDEWMRMLADSQLSEKHYHEFIAEHFGMFFGDGIDTHFGITKLAIGPDRITDFVVPHEDGSNGFVYELIEIKTPHSMNALRIAQQQVEDWGRWLRRCPAQAREILPSLPGRSVGSERYVFTIIIGRRNLTKEQLERRNYKSENTRVLIRSYDYLTDKLFGRRYVDRVRMYQAGEGECPDEFFHFLANPFFTAFSQQEWRSFIRKPFETGHPTLSNYQRLMAERKHNDKLVKKFVEELD